MTKKIAGLALCLALAAGLITAPVSVSVAAPTPEQQSLHDDAVQPSEKEKQAVSTWRTPPRTRAESGSNIVNRTFDLIIVGLTTADGTPYENNTARAKALSDRIAAWYQKASQGAITIKFREFRSASISGRTCGSTNPSGQTIPDPQPGSSGVFIATIINYNSACGYGGLGSLAGVFSIINGTIGASGSLRAITHEMGHNLGLHHATAEVCSPTTKKLPQTGGGLDCEPNRVSEYGDRFSVMGLGSTTFNALHLDKLGVLPTSSVVEGAVSGTYTLAPVYGANRTAARIIYVTTADRLFAVEYRRPSADDEPESYWVKWNQETGVRVTEFGAWGSTLSKNWPANVVCQSLPPNAANCPIDGAHTYKAGAKFELPGGRQIEVVSTAGSTAIIKINALGTLPTRPQTPTVTQVTKDDEYWGNPSYKADLDLPVANGEEVYVQRWSAGSACKFCWGGGPTLTATNHPTHRWYPASYWDDSEQPDWTTKSKVTVSTEIGHKFRIKTRKKVGNKKFESEWSNPITITEDMVVREPEDEPTPVKPKVRLSISGLKTTSKRIGGTCSASCSISIRQPGQAPVNTSSNSQGKWVGNLRAFPRTGSRITIIASKSGMTSTSKNSPKVIQPVVAGRITQARKSARTVKGTCTTQCTVTIRIGKKNYKAEARANGAWTVRTPRLKAGTVLRATFSKSRYKSRVGSYRVRS